MIEKFRLWLVRWLLADDYYKLDDKIDILRTQVSGLGRLAVDQATELEKLRQQIHQQPTVHEPLANRRVARTFTEFRNAAEQRPRSI